MGKLLARLVIVAIGFVCGSNAFAAVTILTNPAQFSGGETVLTFVGATEPLSSYGGVSFALVGYGGAGVWDDPDYAREFGPGETTAINDFPAYVGNPFPYPDMLIGFGALNNRVAFEMRTNPGDNIGVTLYQSNAVVGTASFPTLGPNAYFFYGLESTIDFDELLIDVEENTNGAFALDNLRFENSDGVGAVPEFTSAVVWCVLACSIGLIGFRQMAPLFARV